MRQIVVVDEALVDAIVAKTHERVLALIRAAASESGPTRVSLDETIRSAVEEAVAAWTEK